MSTPLLFLVGAAILAAVSPPAVVCYLSFRGWLSWRKQLREASDQTATHDCQECDSGMRDLFPHAVGCMTGAPYGALHDKAADMRDEHPEADDATRE